MPSQHITEETANRKAILVPLDLDELHIVSQQWRANGPVRVEVMATTTQATCPHCQKRCVKIHDTRPRKKRDISLRGQQVELILLKRRFRCLRCRKSFTEQDKACGWRRKTTVRLREEIGKHACTQPVAHVANAAGVGPRFVQECFQTQAQERTHIGEQFPLLEMAWLLKEELRAWYAVATVTTAAKALDAWIEKVQLQGPDPPRKTLSAFKNWRQEILAFFQFLPTRISNGFVEGKNNRTKALMRQGYGYRNRQHLRLRILLEHVA